MLQIKPYLMAERMGFEPMIELPLYTLSKRAPSTPRPPLHINFISYLMNADELILNFKFSKV